MDKQPNLYFFIRFPVPVTTHMATNQGICSIPIQKISSIFSSLYPIWGKKQQKLSFSSYGFVWKMVGTLFYAHFNEDNDDKPRDSMRFGDRQCSDPTGSVSWHNFQLDPVKTSFPLGSSTCINPKILSFFPVPVKQSRRIRLPEVQIQLLTGAIYQVASRNFGPDAAAHKPRFVRGRNSVVAFAIPDWGLNQAFYGVVIIWLVVLTILKNMNASWENHSHIWWKIKNVWNHQPVIG